MIIYILMEMGAPLQHTPQIAHAVEKYSVQYQIDPIIMLAVMWCESRFNPDAYNVLTYDYGLYQVHCPSTKYAPWCRQRHKLKRIDHNIKTGMYVPPPSTVFILTGI